MVPERTGRAARVISRDDVPGLIARLLPDSVSAVETRDELLDVGLFPVEDLVLVRAVQKRRREFTSGRACARLALGRLGFPPVAVGVGRNGEPLWPAGVVGSITHCRGYAACAVARTGDMLALGIDAEPDDPLPAGVWGDVAFGHELDLASLPSPTPLRLGGSVHVDRLLFSAKESVYKAWFPLTGTWLDFGDVELDVDLYGGVFRAALRVRGPILDGRQLTRLDGRWGVQDGLILTAVALPGPAS
jgi:4'-phosphopantetheinyl transferase EntD